MLGGIKQCKCMVIFWEFAWPFNSECIGWVGYLMIWAYQVGTNLYNSQIPIAAKQNAPQIPMQKAKLWAWNWWWILDHRSQGPKDPSWLAFGHPRAPKVIVGFGGCNLCSTILVCKDLVGFLGPIAFLGCRHPLDPAASPIEVYLLGCPMVTVSGLQPPSVWGLSSKTY